MAALSVSRTGSFHSATSGRLASTHLDEDSRGTLRRDEEVTINMYGDQISWYGDNRDSLTIEALQVDKDGSSPSAEKPVMNGVKSETAEHSSLEIPQGLVTSLENKSDDAISKTETNGIVKEVQTQGDVTVNANVGISESRTILVNGEDKADTETGTVNLEDVAVSSATTGTNDDVDGHVKDSITTTAVTETATEVITGSDGKTTGITNKKSTTISSKDVSQSNLLTDTTGGSPSSYANAQNFTFSVETHDTGNNIESTRVDQNLEAASAPFTAGMGTTSSSYTVNAAKTDTGDTTVRKSQSMTNLESRYGQVTEKESSILDTTEKESFVLHTTEKESSFLDRAERESSALDTTEKESSVLDTSEKESSVLYTTEKDSPVSDTGKDITAIDVSKRKAEGQVRKHANTRPSGDIGSQTSMTSSTINTQKTHDSVTSQTKARHVPLRSAGSFTMKSAYDQSPTSRLSPKASSSQYFKDDKFKSHLSDSISRKLLKGKPLSPPGGTKLPSIATSSNLESGNVNKSIDTTVASGTQPSTNSVGTTQALRSTDETLAEASNILTNLEKVGLNVQPSHRAESAQNKEEAVEGVDTVTGRESIGVSESPESTIDKENEVTAGQRLSKSASAQPQASAPNVGAQITVTRTDSQLSSTAVTGSSVSGLSGLQTTVQRTDSQQSSASSVSNLSKEESLTRLARTESERKTVVETKSVTSQGPYVKSETTRETIILTKDPVLGNSTSKISGNVSTTSGISTEAEKFSRTGKTHTQAVASSGDSKQNAYSDRKASDVSRESSTKSVTRISKAITRTESTKSTSSHASQDSLVRGSSKKRAAPKPPLQELEKQSDIPTSLPQVDRADSQRSVSSTTSSKHSSTVVPTAQLTRTESDSSGAAGSFTFRHAGSGSNLSSAASTLKRSERGSKVTSTTSTLQRSESGSKVTSTTSTLQRSESGSKVTSTTSTLQRSESGLKAASTASTLKREETASTAPTSATSPLQRIESATAPPSVFSSLDRTQGVTTQFSTPLGQGNSFVSGSSTSVQSEPVTQGSSEGQREQLLSVTSLTSEPSTPGKPLSSREHSRSFREEINKLLSAAAVHTESQHSTVTKQTTEHTTKTAQSHTESGRESRNSTSSQSSTTSEPTVYTFVQETRTSKKGAAPKPPDTLTTSTTPPVTYYNSLPLSPKEELQESVKEGTVNKLVQSVFKDLQLTGRSLSTSTLEKQTPKESASTPGTSGSEPKKFKFAVEGIDVPETTKNTEETDEVFESVTLRSDKSTDSDTNISSLQRKEKGFTYLRSLDESLASELKKKALDVTARKPHEVVEEKITKEEITFKRHLDFSSRELQDARSKLQKYEHKETDLSRTSSDAQDPQLNLRAALRKVENKRPSLTSEQLDGKLSVFDGSSEVDTTETTYTTVYAADGHRQQETAYQLESDPVPKEVVDEKAIKEVFVPSIQRSEVQNLATLEAQGGTVEKERSFTTSQDIPAPTGSSSVTSTQYNFNSSKVIGGEQRTVTASVEHSSLETDKSGRSENIQTTSPQKLDPSVKSPLQEVVDEKILKEVFIPLIQRQVIENIDTSEAQGGTVQKERDITTRQDIPAPTASISATSTQYNFNSSKVIGGEQRAVSASVEHSNLGTDKSGRFENIQTTSPQKLDPSVKSPLQEVVDEKILKEVFIPLIKRQVIENIATSETQGGTVQKERDITTRQDIPAPTASISATSTQYNFNSSKVIGGEQRAVSASVEHSNLGTDKSGRFENIQTTSPQKLDPSVKSPLQEVVDEKILKEVFVPLIKRQVIENIATSETQGGTVQKERDITTRQDIPAPTASISATSTQYTFNSSKVIGGEQRTVSAGFEHSNLGTDKSGRSEIIQVTSLQKLDPPVKSEVIVTTQEDQIMPGVEKDNFAPEVEFNPLSSDSFHDGQSSSLQRHEQTNFTVPTKPPGSTRHSKGKKEERHTVTHNIYISPKLEQKTPDSAYHSNHASPVFEFKPEAPDQAQGREIVVQRADIQPKHDVGPNGQSSYESRSEYMKESKTTGGEGKNSGRIQMETREMRSEMKSQYMMSSNASDLPHLISPLQDRADIHQSNVRSTSAIQSTRHSGQPSVNITMSHPNNAPSVHSSAGISAANDSGPIETSSPVSKSGHSIQTSSRQVYMENTALGRSGEPGANIGNAVTGGNTNATRVTLRTSSGTPPALTMSLGKQAHLHLKPEDLPPINGNTMNSEPRTVYSSSGVQSNMSTMHRSTMASHSTHTAHGTTVHRDGSMSSHSTAASSHGKKEKPQARVIPLMPLTVDVGRNNQHDMTTFPTNVMGPTDGVSSPTVKHIQSMFEVSQMNQMNQMGQNTYCRPTQAEPHKHGTLHGVKVIPGSIQRQPDEMSRFQNLKEVRTMYENQESYSYNMHESMPPPPGTVYKQHEVDMNDNYVPLDQRANKRKRHVANVVLASQHHDYDGSSADSDPMYQIVRKESTKRRPHQHIIEAQLNRSGSSMSTPTPVNEGSDQYHITLKVDGQDNASSRSSSRAREEQPQQFYSFRKSDTQRSAKPNVDINFTVPEQHASVNTVGVREERIERTSLNRNTQMDHVDSHPYDPKFMTSMSIDQTMTMDYAPPGQPHSDIQPEEHNPRTIEPQRREPRTPSPEQLHKTQVQLTAQPPPTRSQRRIMVTREDQQTEEEVEEYIIAEQTTGKTGKAEEPRFNVVRGNILIKNYVDTTGAPKVIDVVELDDYDEQDFNVEDDPNPFHGRYFQSRENPMYSSHEDLSKLGEARREVMEERLEKTTVTSKRAPIPESFRERPVKVERVQEGTLDPTTSSWHYKTVEVQRSGDLQSEAETINTEIDMQRAQETTVYATPDKGLFHKRNYGPDGLMNPYQTDLVDGPSRRDEVDGSGMTEEGFEETWTETRTHKVYGEESLNTRGRRQLNAHEVRDQRIAKLIRDAPEDSVRQSINVEREEEEIIGPLDMSHVDGEAAGPDGLLNFDTISEQVNLNVEEGLAQVAVKVRCERIVPIYNAEEMYKKSSVIVTRLIEIDLEATEARKRLLNRIMTGNSQQAIEYNTGGVSTSAASAASGKRKLTTKETFKLYKTFMGIAETQDGPTQQNLMIEKRIEDQATPAMDFVDGSDLEMVSEMNRLRRTPDPDTISYMSAASETSDILY